TAPNSQSKFARYRASKKRQGLKLLRIWVPDVNAPGFAEEAARQAEILRGAAEEREILAFIEAATLDWGLEPYDWGPEGPPPGSASPDKH
ncbi:MAG: antitoxin MazE family protein, partial [Bosea sp. (in: a-proteobacteria)]